MMVGIQLRNILQTQIQVSHIIREPERWSLLAEVAFPCLNSVSYHKHISRTLGGNIWQRLPSTSIPRTRARWTKSWSSVSARSMRPSPRTATSSIWLRWTQQNHNESTFYKSWSPCLAMGISRWELSMPCSLYPHMGCLHSSTGPHMMMIVKLK